MREEQDCQVINIPDTQTLLTNISGHKSNIPVKHEFVTHLKYCSELDVGL